MNAKITQQGGYLCAPLGHTVMHFHEGQIVSGIVAELALADGAAVTINMMRAADLERKVDPPVETKKPRGRPRKS